MTPRIEIYKGNDDRYYYHVIASNGQVIASAHQGYLRRWNAERAANNLVRRLRGTVSIEHQK